MYHSAYCSVGRMILFSADLVLSELSLPWSVAGSQPAMQTRPLHSELPSLLWLQPITAHAKAGAKTGTQHDALVPYLWSQGIISWCQAEGFIWLGKDFTFTLHYLSTWCNISRSWCAVLWTCSWSWWLVMRTEQRVRGTWQWMLYQWSFPCFHSTWTNPTGYEYLWWVFVCLSVCLSACLPACLPACLSVYLHNSKTT